MSKDFTMEVSCESINDVSGPNGLVPYALVFG